MTSPATAEAQRSVSRGTILDKASQILSEDGVHALSMRRLSQAVGASTIVLYTHFSDKQDILNELYLEGFARLQAELDAVPAEEAPLEYVAALGRAYRRSAIANPTYYQIMFSDCVKGFRPAPASVERSRECFRTLHTGVERCAAAGLIPAASTTRTAQVLWATLHGLVSLELLGYAGGPAEGEARLEDAIQVLQAGIVAQARQPIPDPTTTTGKA